MSKKEKKKKNTLPSIEKEIRNEFKIVDRLRDGRRSMSDLNLDYLEDNQEDTVSQQERLMSI